MPEPSKKEIKIPVESVKTGMYAEHQKLYPRQSKGLFTNLKALSGIILLGLYYILPWINWDERQIVLFDLPARKFYIFGLTFWPQDAIYLAFLLIVAGLALFFFTTLAGRLWCGFACPQTIWTDVYIWMERLVEGSRQQQMKLDKAPMSPRKFRIKATKQFLWVTFGLFTGFTFVGYFTPVRELTDAVFTLSTSPTETFWIFFYGFATYGNAGWMREQVCIYMCPYARFQSAMFDKNTLIVAYDEKRGENRGRRNKKADYKAQDLGDCVDCGLCVQVCPVGIDIRDGNQYQCISCSLCIDACNEVMEKMAYPKNLVSYTTEHSLEGKKTKIFRPRILIYGTLLLTLFIGMGYSISQRDKVGLDVIRDRNMLYRETNDGWVENVYVLKVMNMTENAQTYKFSAQGIEGLKLEMPEPEVKVKSGIVTEVIVRLQADPDILTERSSKVYFKIQSVEHPDITVEEQARFLGPLNI
ncbi:cytochrome c oxidase accessory protein CcoG [Candidatus Venteria ishoeyi]|uniref:Quinol dehydrogenase membrane component n=1 Tax=Candidatus Venteria ishoeyi TaxID=1899563 RepID=A0A1H6FES7_9GAMM|nr:cytochrome c oxidase accessory protein CcoG [Candidatus Venteria ishoeyi]SEH08572.1 quinol dehydrogenase membrane component [Candidatus Venteria ishoeyi]